MFSHLTEILFFRVLQRCMGKNPYYFIEISKIYQNAEEKRGQNDRGVRPYNTINKFQKIPHFS